mmetsp:Transcript_14035/g.13641  ORF Transcript_14035/g.13641 Transcript_14035/m.13641 type:complete len:169 (-) Transcript_14035:975-1481(-)|eukprot:CAMPEP_0170566710 /NCGR_PEP_ID=MMETSP0211-20121228/80011_1 /TAXON_ID=311385 /ORGANISM="Pseudokeronopsis sp., Strain OXSARD2" /LENGTH=168 /DNA_ID=CAMNT_0010887961 /DNA_START=2147 /DNA_END=2653 /DNA_ORIENTATION=-
MPNFLNDRKNIHMTLDPEKHLNRSPPVKLIKIDPSYHRSMKESCRNSIFVCEMCCQTREVQQTSRNFTVAEGDWLFFTDASSVEVKGKMEVAAAYIDSDYRMEAAYVMPRGQTTLSNNLGELMAIDMVLNRVLAKKAPQGFNVKIFTDSEYAYKLLNADFLSRLQAAK